MFLSSFFGFSPGICMNVMWKLVLGGYSVLSGAAPNRSLSVFHKCSQSAAYLLSWNLTLNFSKYTFMWTLSPCWYPLNIWQEIKTFYKLEVSNNFRNYIYVYLSLTQFAFCSPSSNKQVIKNDFPVEYLLTKITINNK